MFRKSNLYIIAVLLLLVGCSRDEVMRYTFDASIEAPTVDGNTKVHLVDEKWTYWDEGDIISVGSDQSTQVEQGTLVLKPSGQEWNGVFESQLPESSSKFVGLFPHSANNVIAYSKNNFNVQIDFPANQPFQSDTSFHKNVAPMVAYCAGVAPYKFDFHSLFGIVRIQLFVKSSTLNKSISSITFEELSSKQISGLFAVNNFTTYAPKLAPNANNVNNRKITIACNGRAINTSSLLSFYLLLPAQAVTENGATKYKLSMTVKTTDKKSFIKRFTVNVRRNGITFMPAIAVTEWGTGNNAGTSEISIVGNGTQSRPFQIYTVEDMQYIRNCFEAETPKINNRTIDANTYFKVMRSDIVLNNTNWPSGIKNFKGHFTYASSASSTPGITNNSTSPIFQSITAAGEVNNLTVKGTASQTVSAGKYYSPLCYSNAGTIIDCKVSRDANFSLTLSNVIGNEGEAGVAGICVNNTGTIQNCGNSGKIHARNHTIAGICLFNKANGKIIGCHVESPLEVVDGTFNAGGICYKNEKNGLIKDCYFAANISNGVSHWGGIVHTNLGTVKHCFIAHSGIIRTTRTYGGIVNQNSTGGVVDYCWNETSFAAGDGINGEGTGGLGGIVNKMVGGEIRNSYCNIQNVTMNLTSGNAGGIVGIMSGGTIKNCFAKFYISGSGTIGAFVGRMAGGTITNCYSWDPTATPRGFYGAKTSGTLTANRCHNYKTAQEGVSTFTTATLANLLTSLNSGVTAGYMTWKATSTSNKQPILTGTYHQ